MVAVAYGEPKKRALTVLAAALSGVALAYVLNLRQKPEFEFLTDARKVQGSLGQVGRLSVEDGADSTADLFSVPSDAASVVAKAKAEFGRAFESAEEVDGRTATVLTVPRIEGNRVVLLHPPQRTVKILPSKNGTTVEIREYRVPSLLESAMNWVRGKFEI
jgi:hypothetical protein